MRSDSDHVILCADVLSQTGWSSSSWDDATQALTAETNYVSTVCLPRYSRGKAASLIHRWFGRCGLFFSCLGKRTLPPEPPPRTALTRALTVPHGLVTTFHDGTLDNPCCAPPMSHQHESRRRPPPDVPVGHNAAIICAPQSRRVCRPISPSAPPHPFSLLPTHADPGDLPNRL